MQLLPHALPVVQMRQQAARGGAGATVGTNVGARVGANVAGATVGARVAGVTVWRSVAGAAGARGAVVWLVGLSAGAAHAVVPSAATKKSSE